MTQKCFYFGCWNQAGHFMFAPGGRSVPWEERREYYGDRIHLGGTLAPRRMKHSGELCYQGQGKSKEERDRIFYDGEECPQGEFLLHLLNTGYTAIQWWDRCQGDRRSACNSTILLEGPHSAEEMLAALRENFPHVLDNLMKAGVTLVDVTPVGMNDSLHEARRRSLAARREKLAEELGKLVHDAEHWNRAHPNEEPIIIDPNIAPDVERLLAAKDDHEP